MKIDDYRDFIKDRDAIKDRAIKDRLNSAVGCTANAVVGNFKANTAVGYTAAINTAPNIATGYRALIYPVVKKSCLPKDYENRLKPIETGLSILLKALFKKLKGIK